MEKLETLNACGLARSKSAEQGIRRAAISLKSRILNILLTLDAALSSRE